MTKIKCKKCGEIIFSNDRHDMKRCSCGSCAVDGGNDYCRIIGYPEDWEYVKNEERIETRISER